MDISTIKNGALMIRANMDLNKIIENIMDVNTDPKKSRKLTLTLEFKSNDDRTEIFCDMQSKASLQPIRTVSTVFCPVDVYGTVELHELKRGEIPGQTIIDAETGEIVQNKVVNFTK